MPHDHNNKPPNGDARIALIVAFVTLAGVIAVAVYTTWETKRSERAALTSEAGFLCHAMSWQIVYLASNLNPDGWKNVSADDLKAMVLADPGPPWTRPSWFPLRDPVWTALKDRVGDLGDDSANLAGFFNRVEFLDVLRKRRHCYTSTGAKSRFWRIYACTVRRELKICSYPQSWPGAEPKEVEQSMKQLYSNMADELERQLSCEDLSAWKDLPLAGDPQQECDTDMAGPEGTVEHASEKSKTRGH
jgi:hypothetical protein